MRFIICLAASSMFVSCQTKDSQTTELKTFKDSVTAIAVKDTAALVQASFVEKENAELKKEIARGKLLNEIVLDDKVDFKNPTGFFDAPNMDNISVTIYNNSKYDVKNVVVLFDYLDKDRKELSGYEYKVGTVEAGTTKLLNAPAGIGSSVAATIVAYNCRALNMCYDNNPNYNNTNIKNYRCNDGNNVE